jgi:uncharacterized tellurite resistance protein B-like protein
MLDAVRSFMRRLGGDETKPGRHFSDDDMRLALAALLVHCTSIDGAVSAIERDKLRDLLNRTFKLTGEDLDTLLADAATAEQEAVDLYRFTSVLKRQMSEEERVRVVENLWEIVYADGESHEFEENLVWRVAELLGISRQDRIARKRAVSENQSPEGDAG